jgi:hypothetical protein
MNVKIDIVRSARLSASYDVARAWTSDLEKTLRLFPSVRNLRKLDVNQYLSELEPLGTLGIAHAVSYAARYFPSPDDGRVHWKRLEGLGNAAIEGDWRMSPGEGGTELTVRINGELFDVPIPLMLRAVAPAYIQRKFAGLVTTFLERLDRTIK